MTAELGWTFLKVSLRYGPNIKSSIVKVIGVVELIEDSLMGDVVAVVVEVEEGVVEEVEEGDSQVVVDQ